MNLTLRKKAKAEFEKAFSRYAYLMYRYCGIMYEQPALYYSEKLALKGLQQPETKFYLREAERIKRIMSKEKKIYKTVRKKAK